MLKKTYFIFLLFVFVGCSQLLARQGIKTAVEAGRAGDDTAPVETVTTVAMDHANAINGKVIQLETLEDKSVVAIIKDGKGDLHKCKMLDK